MYCDFDTPCDFIVIDTNFSNNIWQIGFPDKAIFNIGNMSNKIVTDTLLAYGINNLSVFGIDVIRMPLDMWIEVFFNHIIDSDTLQDGGYIEISSDGGATWENIINSPNYFQEWGELGMYSHSDTLYNGIPGFSGFTGTYKQSGFSIGMENTDTLNIRFCFISDSIDNQRNGWCIDELWLLGGWEGIHETNEINYKLYPNPIISESLLSFENPNNEKFTLEIIDSYGRLIKSSDNITSNQVVISSTNFTQGIYLFKLYSHHGAYSQGKFIIN